jgi:hypothetical protein
MTPALPRIAPKMSAAVSGEMLDHEALSTNASVTPNAAKARPGAKSRDFRVIWAPDNMLETLTIGALSPAREPQLVSDQTPTGTQAGLLARW